MYDIWKFIFVNVNYLLTNYTVTHKSHESSPVVGKAVNFHQMLYNFYLNTLITVHIHTNCLQTLLKHILIRSYYSKKQQIILSQYSKIIGSIVVDPTIPCNLESSHIRNFCYSKTTWIPIAPENIPYSSMY